MNRSSAAESVWSRMWRWLSDLEATLDLTEVDYVSAQLQRLEVRVAALEGDRAPAPIPRGAEMSGDRK